MKSLLPDILEGEILEELEKSKEIIYFNLLPNADYSKLSEEQLQKLSDGDSHAIVGKDLYVKGISSKRQYILRKKDFLKSKEDNS